MIDILKAYESINVYIEQWASDAYEEGGGEFCEYEKIGNESDCESYKDVYRSSDDEDEFLDEGEIPEVSFRIEQSYEANIHILGESDESLNGKNDGGWLEEVNNIFSQVEDEVNYGSNNSEYLGSPRNSDSAKIEYPIYDKKKKICRILESFLK